MSITAGAATTRNSRGLNWRASRRISRRHVVGHGARGAHAPAALALLAGLAQQLRQRFARALARHLHQAQGREAAHLGLDAVARQLLAELGQHGVLVLGRAMSMKSTMMMPPRLRSRSWRAMACAASRLVLKMVSSKLRAPTKPPVLTSMVVSASVWSTIR
jgi:hypothetical protein